MSKDEDNYIGVILEEIRDQNKAVLEAVGDMQSMVAKIPNMEEDLAELKSDVQVIKTVVTDISKRQNQHEVRITKLEATQ